MIDPRWFFTTSLSGRYIAFARVNRFLSLQLPPTSTAARFLDRPSRYTQHYCCHHNGGVLKQ